MKKSRFRTIIVMHIMFFIYSFGGVCSKYAAGEAFLSGRFLLFYGIVLFLLAFYAFAWQQIIKQLPLTLAYANKAVSVLWAMIWGMVFFQEKPTTGKIVGALLVAAGIVLFAFSDSWDAQRKQKVEEKCQQ
ncbi:MAG: transporter [Lachnospiraceae bacterium]|nr:transporter [Lachnospiraceae bacterium]